MRILSKDEFKLFKKVLVYLKPYKFKIAFLYTFAIMEALLRLIPLFLMGKVIDYAITKRFDLIVNNVIVLIILFIAASILNFSKTYLDAYLDNKITFDIKKDIFYHIEKLKVYKYDKIGIGNFISRLEGDTMNISRFYLKTLLNIFIGVIKLLATVVLMIFISKTLFFIALCCFPISFCIYYFLAKKIRKITLKGRKLTDKYFTFIQQVFCSIREVKSLVIEKKCYFQYKNVLGKMCKNNVSLLMTSSISGLLSTCITNICQWSIMIYGCLLIIRNSFSVGQYVAFNAYLQTFLDSVQAIMAINLELQTTGVSIKRVYEILDEDVEDYGCEDKAFNFNGEIQIKNLNFHYDDLVNVELINNLNVTIKPKTFSAFVGVSGCGKSTLFNLLMHFYEYTGGEILFDGTSMKEINLTTLRKNITYIQQEPYIYNMSIKDNLLLANSKASMEEIITACKAAYIDDFIESLPDKYDTIVGEGANRLSGGQKQRLAIARSILKKSRIYLLDEVTSGLDGESEVFLIKTLNNLAKDHTVIMIAHRLTTIIALSNIYVFDNGRIVANGNHRYLINNCEAYKRLYKAQCEEYALNS